ncbi:MAG: T9SS type A sorting domain-containing protein [Bacteroidetes bacterium]|nr:T9SS type A sorting domain-containing protein [Bacteroidota bacterium]
MKKTLLSLSILFSLGASAQLTQANHAPTVGFNYEIFQCDTAVASQGATIGAGAVWNFTALATSTVPVANYTTAVASNTTYPSADVSVSSAATDIAYFKSSATGLEYYGGDVSFGIANGTLIYTNPAVYAAYPMALNTSTTSTPSGSVVVFGNTGVIGGTVTAMVDGTGTLNLDVPGAAAGTTLKSFTDAIRVKTTEYLLGNVTLAFPPIAITFTVTRENYDFYSPSASRAPLLSISNFTANLSSVGGPTVNTVKSVTVQRDYNVVSVNESQKASIELSVYPNPAATVINFATTSAEATKVMAFDVTGKLVATEVLEMGKAKMNLSNLSSGMYIYHVVDKNNLVLKSDKFNVSK